MLDSPVSGGPGGAASGKMAIWVGGDQQQFGRHKRCSTRWATRRDYIGPIGAGTIAKLVHNCTSARRPAWLAEVMTMGVKAGVDPLDFWEAVRQGATGRQRTFDRLGEFLSSSSTRPTSPCACCTRTCRWRRARQGGGGADAARQPGAGGADRGAEPRLGPARHTGRRSVSRRARRRGNRRRHRGHRASLREGPAGELRPAEQRLPGLRRGHVYLTGATTTSVG